MNNLDKSLQTVMEKHIEKTITALEKNNIKGYYAKDVEEAKKIIAELVKDDNVMTSGGSMTLEQTGILQWLRETYGDKFVNRDFGNRDEAVKAMKQAFTADTFFASTNAVTENGELYNVDGNGNRVAAMIYGPEQVIIVCGYNKIVADLDAAKTRLEQIAAPANTVRLSKNTPCSKTGVCGHCHSEDRICCTYVTMAQQRTKDRIKVIFLPFSLGY